MRVTRIQDDFLRSDAAAPLGALPRSGMSWEVSSIEGLVSGMRILTTTARWSGANAGNAWLNVSFGPRVEVFACIGAATTTASATMSLYLRGQAFGTANNDDYMLRVTQGNGLATWSIYRHDNNVATLLSETTGPSPRFGDTLRFVADGTHLMGYFEPPYAGTSVMVVDAYDSTYPNAGAVGFGTNVTTVGYLNFGGGTIPTGVTGNAGRQPYRGSLTAGSQNLLPDGSFELDNLPAYQVLPAGSAVWPGYGRDGGKALLITAGVGGDGHVYSSTAPARVAAVAGDVVTASHYVRMVTSAPRDHRMDIRFFDAGGATLSTVLGATTTQDSTDGWVRHTCTATAPVNTASVGILARLVGLQVGDQLLVDDMELVMGATMSTAVPRTNETPALPVRRTARRSRTNLILNPDGDLGTQGWSISGGYEDNLYVDGTWTVDGNANSIRVVYNSNFAGTRYPGITYTPGSVGGSRGISVQPGALIWAAALIKHHSIPGDVVGNSTRLILRYWKADGSALGGLSDMFAPANVTQLVDGDVDWQRTPNPLQLRPGRVPAGAAYVTPMIYMVTTAIGHVADFAIKKATLYHGALDWMPSDSNWMGPPSGRWMRQGGALVAL